jgi:hypothetical protein
VSGDFAWVPGAWLVLSGTVKSGTPSWLKVMIISMTG